MVNFTTVACRISSRLKWYKNCKNRLRLAKVVLISQKIKCHVFYGSLCKLLTSSFCRLGHYNGTYPMDFIHKNLHSFNTCLLRDYSQRNYTLCRRWLSCLQCAERRHAVLTCSGVYGIRLDDLHTASGVRNAICCVFTARLQL